MFFINICIFCRGYSPKKTGFINRKFFALKILHLSRFFDKINHKYAVLPVFPKIPEVWRMKEAVIKYSDCGIKKVKMPLLRVLVSAFLAGMFISLAGAGAVIGSATVQSGSVARLLMALIFPAGLAMVVIVGAELFTGNCLMVVSLLDGKIKPASLAANWAAVYIGNFFGALFVSTLAVYGNMYAAFGGQAAETAATVAAAKCSVTLGEAVCRGILCNIMVCIAVLMAMTAQTSAGKIAALFLPIMIFVLCGFEHSVANMGYVSAGMMLKASGRITGYDEISLFGFLIKNLLPVTAANIIGGALAGAACRYIVKD